jgi:predicted PurR-regulated permease PerM
VFEGLEPRLGPRWAALGIVLATLLALGGALTGLAWLLVSDGTALTNEWLSSLGPGGPGHAVVGAVSAVTSRLGVPADELTARARELAETVASGATTVAAMIVSTAASVALSLVFAMLSMHFILRHWRAVALGAQEVFPLRPDYTAALFAEFRRVGRSTLLGTIGTGVAQGLLATFGFWITGVPYPLFFGAATAVASLVPVVGAALVWLPAGIVLIVLGHPVRGGLELVWGALLVAIVSDYVIRPRLVGGGGHLPQLVTFAALLGGVQVFGLKGLIVGPVLMALAVAILRLYASEARKRRSPSTRLS